MMNGLLQDAIRASGLASCFNGALCVSGLLPEQTRSHPMCSVRHVPQCVWLCLHKTFEQVSMILTLLARQALHKTNHQYTHMSHLYCMQDPLAACKHVVAYTHFRRAPSCPKSAFGNAYHTACCNVTLLSLQALKPPLP